MATTETLSLWIKLKDDFTKNAQKVKGEFTAMTSSFKKGMDEAGNASNALNSKLGTAVGMLKTPLALAIAGISGLGLALKATANAGVEFSQAMKYVGVHLDNFDGAVRDLSGGVLRLSAELGRDQTSLAWSMEAVADAGFKGAEGLEVLKRVAMLARTTHSDLAMTTDLVTKSMVSLGIGAKDAGTYTERLYKMSILGIGNFSDMALVMEGLAGTFRTAGLSADELMAAVAHMSNLFPRNREAVMTMRSAIESIRSPSKDAAELAALLGVKLDLASVQAMGFGKWMQDLAEKTEGNEKVLDTLLGTTGSWKAVLAMTGKDGADYARILDEIKAKTDKMGKTNAEVMGAAKGQWDIMKASISSALASIWENWDATFAKMIGWINTAMKAWQRLDLMMKGYGIGPALGWINRLIGGGKGKGPGSLAEMRAGEGAEDYGQVVPPPGKKRGGKSVEDIYREWMASKEAGAGKAKGEDKWEKAAKAHEELVNREWQAVVKAEEDWYEEEKKLQADAIDERFAILDEGLKAAADRWKAYQDEVAETEREDADRIQESADIEAEIAQADIDRTIEAYEQMTARNSAIFSEFFGSLSVGSLSEERRGALGQMAADFKENYESLYDLTRGVAEAMQSAFSDLFFDAMTGQLKSFKDYAMDFLNSVSRMIADYVAQLVKMMIEIGVAKLAAGIAGGAAGGGAWGGVGSGGAAMYHRGGWVGQKFHFGGLSSGEVPAILRRGEFVVNEDAAARNRNRLDAMNRGGGESQAQPPTTVNIYAMDSKSFYEFCQRSPNAVIAPLIDNLNRSGSARSAIAGSM